MTREQFENFINAMMMCDVSVEGTEVNDDNLSPQIDEIIEESEEE